MKIPQKLENKKILIWGYGVEGRACKEFIDRVCDAESVEVFEGEYKDIDYDRYDYIIKSPGIPYRRLDKKIISQTSLFLEEFRDNIIGVTGTKGKSTTSSLLYHTLKEAGKDVVLVGNIGVPPLSLYEEIKPDTIIVFEMSAHQLLNLKVSPHVAIYLNLYEDHLDFYENKENYHKAKSMIAHNQLEGDYFYVGENVPDIDTAATKNIMKFRSDDYMKITSIDGAHNRYNAAIVIRVASEIYHVDRCEARDYIETFSGLKHRLQRVYEADGITYYDDSISTICQSAILATESIENAGTVLIGGMDRGIDYTDLEEFIRERKDVNFICMYESGKRVYNNVNDCLNIFYCNDLQETVILAKKITNKGKACILSPAAASYGYFKNFEERGDVFTRLVKGE